MSDSSDDETHPSSLFSGSGKIAPSLTDSVAPSEGSISNLGSPAPSVYSLTESLIAASIREEHGRQVQNHSDVYNLPADNPEFERLDKQHRMLNLILGKYPQPLVEILRNPSPHGDPLCVLDLGCGTGAWLADIAADFPHVEAIGVDLVPPQITYAPPNVRTEIDDINLGLEHFFGCCNVVHCRLIATGIKDYPGLIDQISRILRPGGLIILGETDFRVFTEQDDGSFRQCQATEKHDIPCAKYLTRSSQPVNADRDTTGFLPPAEDGSPIPATVRFMDHLRAGVRTRGGHIDAAPLLHRWVSQHHAFEDVVSRDLMLPSSPFVPGDSAEAKRQRKIGQMVCEDVREFAHSARPLILKTGAPEEEVDSLMNMTIGELDRKVPIYFRMQYVYARKK